MWRSCKTTDGGDDRRSKNSKGFSPGSVKLLQHLTQRDERALLASIKELMAHQLVVEESADRFAFRHALYEAARQRARVTDDRQGEWQALLDLALLWGGRDYARVGDFVQRALKIAREAGDPFRLAHTLNRLGNWYTNVERPHEGLRCHQEALDIFEGLQDRRGLAETLDFLGMAATLAASPAQSAAYYARAIPLLEELDDRQRLVISLTMWGFRAASIGVRHPSRLPWTAPTSHGGVSAPYRSRVTWTGLPASPSCSTSAPSGWGRVASMRRRSRRRRRPWR